MELLRGGVSDSNGLTLDNTFFPFPFPFPFPFSILNRITFLVSKKEKNRKRKCVTLNLAPPKKGIARFYLRYLPTLGTSCFWYEMMPCLFPKL